HRGDGVGTAHKASLFTDPRLRDRAAHFDPLQVKQLEVALGKDRLGVVDHSCPWSALPNEWKCFLHVVGATNQYEVIQPRALLKKCPQVKPSITASRNDLDS